MKRLKICILVCAFFLGLCMNVYAEEVATGYELGNKMEDFTATLIDGTEVSLYELLEEKKAVLINIWATWCGPCKMEFPYMEKAYTEMMDDIGALVLSCEPTDTVESITAVREEAGISNLPMGVDTNGLGEKFSVESIPTTIMVDRNGIICFRHSGAITEAGKFTRLFKAFTADDYETTVYEDFPAAQYEGSRPTGDELKAALCPDLDVQFLDAENAEAYPFLPTEEGVAAANSGDKATTAELVFTVNSEKNQKLGYSVKMNCDDLIDRMTVSVDDEPVYFYTGNAEWREDYLTLGAAGEHKVAFAFVYSEESGAEEVLAQIRDLHIATEEEVAAIDAAKADHPSVLEGAEMQMEVLSDLQDVVYDDERLLDALGGDDGENLRMLKDGSITIRITVGPEVDVYQACVKDFTGKGFLLADLPQDETGFLLTKTAEDFMDQAHAMYGMEMLIFSPNDLNESAESGWATFVLVEDVINYNMNYMMEALGIEEDQRDSAWHYEDNYYPKQYS